MIEEESEQHIIGDASLKFNPDEHSKHKAELEGVYRGDTLDLYGLIHYSTSEQIVKVANDQFRAQKGLGLLCIVTSIVRSKIRYECARSEELYPHIYGPLNINAVIKVADFEPAKDGRFRLPKKCMF